MTRRFKLAAVAGLALSAALLATGAKAHCGKCGMGEEKTAKAADAKAHDCKGTCPLHKAGCPAKIEGAETSVTNTAEGVTIVIKGKDAKMVKMIQEAGAKMASGDCCGHHKEHGHKGAKKAAQE